MDEFPTLTITPTETKDGVHIIATFTPLHAPMIVDEEFGERGHALQQVDQWLRTVLPK